MPDEHRGAQSGDGRLADDVEHVQQRPSRHRVGGADPENISAFEFFEQ
jgi:hypothetical protein